MDTVKGWLVLFVILGHCLQLMNPMDMMSSVVVNTFTSFHVPLFVLLSGYYTHFRSLKKSGVSILRIVESFVVFQLLTGLIEFAFTHDARSFFTLGFALWYLVGLIVWRSIYCICTAIKVRSVVLLVGSLITTLLLNVIPHFDVMPIVQRVVAYAPFFFVGTCLHKFKLQEITSIIPVTLAVVIMLTPLLSIVLCGRYPMGTLFGYGKGWMSGFGRWGMLAWSITIAASFYRIVKPRRLMAYVGRDSLRYYLFHAPFIVLAHHTVCQGEGITPVMAYSVFFVSVGMIVALGCFSKTNNFILNPISSIYKK